MREWGWEGELGGAQLHTTLILKCAPDSEELKASGVPIELKRDVLVPGIIHSSFLRFSEEPEDPDAVQVGLCSKIMVAHLGGRVLWFSVLTRLCCAHAPRLPLAIYSECLTSVPQSGCRLTWRWCRRP